MEARGFDGGFAEAFSRAAAEGDLTGGLLLEDAAFFTGVELTDLAFAI